jgi:hypothetical protein
MLWSEILKAAPASSVCVWTVVQTFVGPLVMRLGVMLL